MPHSLAQRHVCATSRHVSHRCLGADVAGCALIGYSAAAASQTGYAGRLRLLQLNKLLSLPSSTSDYARQTYAPNHRSATSPVHRRMLRTAPQSLRRAH